MNTFLQAKIAFAIGLLVLVLTIYPIVNDFREVGFIFFGSSFSLMRAYYAFAILLSLSVYFYALSFLNEDPKILTNKLGNISYAAAISVPLIYFGTYIIQSTILLLYKIASLVANLILNKVLGEFKQEYFVVAGSAIFASLVFTKVFTSIDMEERGLSKYVATEHLRNVDPLDERLFMASRGRFISLASFFIFLFIPIVINLFKIMIWD